MTHQEMRPASRGLTHRFTQRFQKPRRRPPPPPPPVRDEDPDAEDYINLQDDIYENNEAFRFAAFVNFRSLRIFCKSRNVGVHLLKLFWYRAVYRWQHTSHFKSLCSNGGPV